MKLDWILACVLNENYDELVRIRKYDPISEYSLWAQYAIAVINSKSAPNTAMVYFEKLILDPHSPPILKTWCQFGKAELYRVGGDGLKAHYHAAKEIYTKLLTQKLPDELQKIINFCLSHMSLRIENDQREKTHADKYIYSLVDVEEVPSCSSPKVPKKSSTKKNYLELTEKKEVNSVQGGAYPLLSYDQLVEKIKAMSPERLNGIYAKIGDHSNVKELLNKIVQTNKQSTDTTQESEQQWHASMGLPPLKRANEEGSDDSEERLKKSKRLGK